MLDHRREQDVERQEERARPQQPAPALQFGTLGWASAMGSQAVARIAREAVAEEAPEVEAEAEAPPSPEAQAMPEALEEPTAEEEESELDGIPEDLPEELPA